MKKTTIITIIIGAAILLIIILFTIQSSNIISFNPDINSQNQTNFCSDSDGDNNITAQSMIKGFVFFIHNECNLTQINIPDSQNNFCAYSLTYNDYCINESVLREKVCNDNIVGSVDISCKNKCSNGICS